MQNIWFSSCIRMFSCQQMGCLPGLRGHTCVGVSVRAVQYIFSAGLDVDHIMFTDCSTVAICERLCKSIYNSKNVIMQPCQFSINSLRHLFTQPKHAVNQRISTHCVTNHPIRKQTSMILTFWCYAG